MTSGAASWGVTPCNSRASFGQSSCKGVRIGAVLALAPVAGGRVPADIAVRVVEPIAQAPAILGLCKLAVGLGR